LIAGGYAIVQHLLGNTVSGWPSLMVSIWFVGGVQLMGIGMIGEYIGKIYHEVKNRPRYAIETDLYTMIDSELVNKSQR
jgi:glycosyltransferase involved in cell wall biosynthesis